MEFRLLGPIEALRDGRSLPLGGAKPRALLALLLLHANEVVSRDRLIEALWADRRAGHAPSTASTSRSRGYARRSSRTSSLVTRGGGYVLEVEPEQIDARRFERLLEDGRRANAAGEPADAARGARGRARRSGAARRSAISPTRSSRARDVERLEELRLAATEERIDAELALGHHDRLIPELEALTAKHPLRERLRGQLMLALYRAGRQAEALRVYADTRKRLVDGARDRARARRLRISSRRSFARIRRSTSRARPRRRRRRRCSSARARSCSPVPPSRCVVGLTQGGTESAQALAEPDSNVFLSAETGELVAQGRLSATRSACAYGAGCALERLVGGRADALDPDDRRGCRDDSASESEPGGLAVGAGLGLGDGQVLADRPASRPAVNEVVDRFQLPTKGVGTI